jgi:hypothetical protein
MAVLVQVGAGAAFERSMLMSWQDLQALAAMAASQHVHGHAQLSTNTTQQIGSDWQ